MAIYYGKGGIFLKKISWKKLIICIAIPLAVGGISAFLTKDAMRSFESIPKPPLSPPGWLFPVAWTILYVLMGLASYGILTADAPAEEKQNTLYIYAVQLGFNFFWSLFFFNGKLYLFSFVWLMVMWALIIWLTVRAYHIRKWAAWCLIPYILWVTFAAYLNLGVYLLN